MKIDICVSNGFGRGIKNMQSLIFAYMYVCFHKIAKRCSAICLRIYLFSYYRFTCFLYTRVILCVQKKCMLYSRASLYMREKKMRITPERVYACVKNIYALLPSVTHTQKKCKYYCPLRGQKNIQ